jgi:hypothetical protein
MDRRSVIRTALRLAAGALLALAVSACTSFEPSAPSPRPEPPPFVSGAEVAAHLGLTRRPIDDGGKIALVAEGGDQILLFPETRVASIRGTQLRTSEPVELRGGDAWLHPDDAAAIESMWTSSPLQQPLEGAPPVQPPTTGSVPPAGPRAAPPSGASHDYSDQPTPAEVAAWSVRHRGRQWHYIVIHHSGTDTGSAAQFDAWHRKKGWDGLAYDFVIGNGTGSPDGAVEVGYRWREQKRGAHAGNDLMNVEGIGICLVGDFTKTRPTAAQMHSLARLCNFLSDYCDIPRESFRLHGDVRQTSCPGPLFPRDFLAPQRSPRLTAAAAQGGSGTE